MSISKKEFERQQEHEAGAVDRAAEKQAEITADLERLKQAGGASLEDIEGLQKLQSEVADDLEIIRRKREREKGDIEF
jgi:hypothetical protein